MAEREGPRCCFEWVFASGSNVHVATHRSWFVDYVPFSSEAYSRMGSEPLQVEGIGRVVLKVKKHLSRSGRQSHNEITLEDVLHVPGAFCNIVGSAPSFDYTVALGERALYDRQGNLAGRFEQDSGLLILKLSGGRPGPSVFDPNTYYCISVYWPDEEMARWEWYQSTLDLLLPDSPDLPDLPDTDYVLTQAELRWIKDNFESTLVFLASYRLKPWERDDLMEAKGIVKAFKSGNQSTTE